MPMTWDATNSMQMLLLVIAEADVKPSAGTWTKVANKLGDITPSAVSQKFYKLKKESEQLKAGDRTAGPSTPKAKASGSTKTPGTIRGRKRKDASDEEIGRITKRQKRPTAGVAEEDPEENEAPNVEDEEQGDADEVAD